MPGKGWNPSIVPYSADQTVYLVVDDFGRKGAPIGKLTSRPPILKPPSLI
jgi:hypothetical protein